jgi:tetratricopeptide (TPR) repeat protein
MNKTDVLCFSIIVLIAVLLSSCAAPLKTMEIEKPPVEPEKKYVPTEQETKSLEVFTEILEVIEATNDRQSAIPKIEELYTRIIREYPEAPLAQESYWKLITIYVEDYSPPQYDKAEARYHEFLEKYPQSILRGMIDDTLGKSYYKSGDWKKLLELCTPAFKGYIEEGKQPRPTLLFMYSEANYHLGNFEEAEKGYEIVAEQFPKLSEGMMSKKILEKIKKNQD